MRVVAGQAVGFGKGLALVRLMQLRSLCIVAVQRTARGRLGQMESILCLPNLARLVRDVAGVAAHVECGVAAAFLPGHSCPACGNQAEIVFLVARGRLQQLILIVGIVRVVAFEAVANRGRVHCPFDRRGVFVGVAVEAESLYGDVVISLRG